MWRLIRIPRSNSTISRKIPVRANNVAAQNQEVVRELDRLIKGARTVSPIEKFNFPRSR